MSVKTIMLGTADEAALERYAEKLLAAYANGKANGGSVDHSDMQLALDQATEAFGAAGKEFKDAVHALEYETGEEIDFEEVRVSFGDREPSTMELSAAKFLDTYATPDDFDWDKADDAYETMLEAGSAPKP